MLDHGERVVLALTGRLEDARQWAVPDAAGLPRQCRMLFHSKEDPNDITAAFVITAREAACSNIDTQPCPRTFGVRRGWWVGRSAAGIPWGGWAVGTPTYIPQNDAHDALIIWNIHKRGKLFFQQKCAHQLRLPPISQGATRMSGRTQKQTQKLCVCFSPIFQFSTEF